MDREELESAATPEQMAAAVSHYKDDLAVLHEGHDHPAMSMREVAYKGHNIRIMTTYEIDVDGVPITGHLLVSNEGSIHYHAIPNQEFTSAVDLVKRIIDLSPEAFGVHPTPPPDHSGDDHAGHDHMHPHQQ